MIRRILGEFFGALPFYFAVAALLMWGLVRLSRRLTNLSRVARILISYGFVAGIAAGLWLISIDWNDTMFLDHSLRHLAYQQISIILCLAVALLFWEKRKRKARETSANVQQ